MNTHKSLNWACFVLFLLVICAAGFWLFIQDIEQPQHLLYINYPELPSLPSKP